MTETTKPDVVPETDENKFTGNQVVGFLLLGVIAGLVLGHSAHSAPEPVKRYEHQSHGYRLEAIEQRLALQAAYEAGKQGKEWIHGPTS